MFKIQKTTKGTIDYLVNSENQFSRTNEELSLGGSGLPSLTELARMKREIGHSRQEMASNFEQYMSRNTDHHKASFGGGLGQKFGFEYSAKNFELLKKGFWPGTKEDFERIYKKERGINSTANKNLDIYSRFNKYTTIKKEQNEVERKNKNIHIDNMYLQELKKKYPLVFELSIRVGEILNEELGIDISENELGFLALHLGAAYERTHNHQHYKAIMIYPMDQAFGDILLKNIWRFKIFVIPLRSKDK